MIDSSRPIWDRLRGGWFSGRAERRAAAKDVVPEKSFAEMLEPPSDLVSALAAGECIMVAGEGLSKLCGISLWRSFVLGLVEWASDLHRIDPRETEQSREAHKKGEFDRVAEALLKRFAERPELIHGYARSMYLKPAALSNVHEIIRQIPFAGVITPNLDVLLERALGMRQDELFHPDQISEVSARVAEKRRFALKMRGHWEEPASITLIPSHALASCTGTPEYARLIAFLLTARTLMFVGIGLDEVRTMLEPASPQNAPERKHFVLIPKSEVPRRGEDAMLKRNRVHGLVYPDGDTSRISDFLAKLAPAQAIAPSAVAAE